YDVQGAIYDRAFNLPESFFRKFESAELAQRIMGAGAVVNLVASVVLTSIVALVFILVYFLRMASYSWVLSLIALLMVVLYSLLYYGISIRAFRYKQRAAELEGKTSSIM